SYPGYAPPPYSGPEGGTCCLFLERTTAPMIVNTSPATKSPKPMRIDPSTPATPPSGAMPPTITGKSEHSMVYVPSGSDRKDWTASYEKSSVSTDDEAE